MHDANALVSRTETLDVGGVTVEFLTDPLDNDPYCALKGTIPAGTFVPLHSHTDPESFFVVSGKAEILLEREGELEWHDVKSGDFVHIPGGVKHAHRNRSNLPVVQLLFTSTLLGQFFQELGKPLSAGRKASGPTIEDIQRLLDLSDKYGHWLATPAENAAVGLTVSRS